MDGGKGAGGGAVIASSDTSRGWTLKHERKHGPLNVPPRNAPVLARPSLPPPTPKTLLHFSPASSLKLYEPVSRVTS